MFHLSFESVSKGKLDLANQRPEILHIMIGIALFGLFILTGCQKKQENTVATFEEFPDQEGWTSTVTTTKNGIVGATIQYGHMQQFKKKKVIDFDNGIVIDFFDADGEHTSKLTSANGRLNEATNDIEAFGNVAVISDTGITLQTERLRWDNNIEKIVSNDSVTIITAEQDTFYGKGFESDQNLQNWRIISFSGKSSRGLNLNYDINKKKQAGDSSAIKPETGSSDTLKK
jgi:LPS export ABC transporter protein LptC